MNILDKDAPNALRYPSIKNEGEDAAQEYRITLPVRDIIIPGISETVYFPLDFCLENIVIDGIAKKYAATVENYPDGTDEEHFLIGIESCRQSKTLNCPYMKKALARIIAAKNIASEEVIAIYLLSTDDSSDNRQKFLLMTKTKLYLLHSTQAIENYRYNEIFFTHDGIERKKLAIQSVKIFWLTLSMNAF